jgi:zinc/manganese transport system substrate-binding protein
MISRRKSLAAAAAFAALWVAGPAVAQEKLKVVATFSILADFVKNVGGDRIEIATLVGPGADAHVYSPTPADAKTLAAAKVVFTNGLGFEGWIERLIKASATKAQRVVATRGIKARKLEEKGHHDHDHHHHGHSDPHAWQSVANAKIYVANIRDALSKADPAGKSTYEANARAYTARLDALEKEVREAVARIPAGRRKIITSHEAFGYFQAAYGIAFVAPQGISTESEPSAADVARIITQIRREKIPAVFLENVTDARLLKRIAEESGAKIGGTLYSDALTDAKGDAPTYLDMMRHNARQLAAALMS